MNRDEVIQTLNELIETCKDGEDGFRTCAEGVKNPAFKTFFEERAERCALGARQFAAKAREFGGNLQQRGSTSGMLHRFSVNIRSSITGMDDAAILAECERGEDSAKDAYEEALRRDLPGDVRVMIAKQYREVRDNHDRVRDMRNAMA